MNIGKPESSWGVYFHPVTGNHLPSGPGFGGLVPNDAFDPSVPVSPTNLRSRKAVLVPADYTFRNALQVGDFTRGRSQLRVEMRSFTRCQTFYMSMRDFWDTILPTVTPDKPIAGTWGFKLQGTTTLLVRLSAH